MKLWAGRFVAEENSDVHDFNSSLRFDCRLYEEDILGSVAHVTMLAGRGIVSNEDADTAIAGLMEILAELKAGTLAWDDSEDIHSFVEAELTRRVGDAGKRIHTGRSRNDQVALDFRWYCKKQALSLGAAVRELMGTLVTLAEQHLETIMPGYTHLQRAQPITLAHHLMAWCEMLRRDATRLDDAVARMDECPLGSGALAGTTYPIDRELTAQKTGFARPMPNSLDGVADRDFAVELLSGLSLLMCHLSRMSEEVILWCSSEFRFADLDDAYSTGSSIMPQKKNPDVAELVRGKTGRVYGDLIGMLTVLKGLPLAYNKDLQEDKESLFDAVDTVALCLRVFGPMVETLRFNKDIMKAAAAKGFLNATDCADYLVRQGLPFREAYKITGQLVRKCVESGKTLEDLPLEELKALSPLFGEDVYESLSLSRCVMERRSQGGPAPESVAAHIRLVKEFLA